MSKEILVILLGAAVVAITQLGIPGNWRSALLVLAGIVIVGVGFALRAEALGRGKRTQHHNFVENGHSHNAHERKDGIGSLN
jgi:hypothetical protein